MSTAERSEGPAQAGERRGKDQSAEAVERLLAEDAVPVRLLAEQVPAERGSRRTGTLVRWITHGKSGVKLEGFFGPGQGWYSSRAALARFLAALTQRENERQRAVSHTAPEKSHGRAAKAWAKLGTLKGRKSDD